LVRNPATSPGPSPYFPVPDWPGTRAILAWAALFLFCPGLAATEVPDLYRAELAVPNKDEAVRPESFRRGLEQVLGRVLRPQDLSSAGVRTLLAKPETAVLEFVYPGTAKEGHPILRVDYDAERIGKLLGSRGIGVFGPARPETMVWIAVEDESPARILGPDALPDWNRILGELAAERGLPLTLPLGDLADTQSLSPGDIATGNIERLLSASERYEAEAILAGRVARKPEGYEADWRLYRGSRKERWQGKSADLREVLNSGVSGAYSRIAGQFISRGAGTATLELRIGGIASLDDVNRVTAYLGQLSTVAKAELLSLEADQALFKLSVRGGREALEQSLAMGNRLRPESGGDPGFSGLSYRLPR
jgi:hypothetical protein